MRAIALLLVAVSLSVSGELLLKHGMNQAGVLSLQPHLILSGLARTFRVPAIWGGFALIFSGAIFWLAVLSRVELSYAYPMLSIGYVIGVVASWVVLGEQVNLQRLFGALIVFLGFLVVATSRS